MKRTHTRAHMCTCAHACAHIHFDSAEENTSLLQVSGDSSNSVTLSLRMKAHLGFSYNTLFSILVLPNRVQPQLPRGVGGREDEEKRNTAQPAEVALLIILVHGMSQRQRQCELNRYKGCVSKRKPPVPSHNPVSGADPHVW